MLLIQQRNFEQKSFINNIHSNLKGLKNFEVFYLFLIFFTFSLPLLKKLKPAKTANESQTIKKAIFIVKTEDKIQNHIDHIIFQRNVANCSAHEMSQILSFCACSVIIADTTGFITESQNEIQNDTIKIIIKDKLNHNRINNHAKNTKTTAMNNFLLNHSSRHETNKLNIYGNLITANTIAICHNHNQSDNATNGINNKLK